MNFEINLTKAINSLKLMHNYFTNKEIENKAQVVLPNVIEHNSSQHFCYLFFSCLLNFGMRSNILHENLCLLYETNSEIFSPQYIVENYSNNYTKLAKLLSSKVHIRYPNECAKRWIALSELLHANFDNNPQNLFVGKNKYNEYKLAISQINGFGQKTGGLLLRMLIDNEMLISSDGIAEIPIDRHDIDLCVWLEVISNISTSEIRKNKKIVNLLSATWVQASKELSISPSLTDQYLWIIGTQFCVSRNCKSCPLHYVCSRKD